MENTKTENIKITKTQKAKIWDKYNTIMENVVKDKYSDIVGYEINFYNDEETQREWISILVTYSMNSTIGLYRLFENGFKINSIRFKDKEVLLTKTIGVF